MVRLKPIGADPVHPSALRRVREAVSMACRLFARVGLNRRRAKSSSSGGGQLVARIGQDIDGTGRPCGEKPFPASANCVPSLTTVPSVARL